MIIRWISVGHDVSDAMSGGCWIVVLWCSCFQAVVLGVEGVDVEVQAAKANYLGNEAS